MSKLDTILKQFRGWSPMSDGQFDELSNKMSADIKKLMLELIGEDYINTSFGGGKDSPFVKVGNKIKAELRQKVSEL